MATNPVLDTVKTGSNSAGTISVIIPTFGNGVYLERCLESLRNCGTREFQVLLVDDGSPEPVVKGLNGNGSEVECYRLEENSGPCHAINRGLERTNGKWVVILNSDVELRPGSLETLVAAVEERPNYQFAVAKLLHQQAKPTVDSLGDAMLIGGGGYRVGNGEWDNGQCTRVRPVLGVCGTASVFSRSLLNEVGGFDEDFFGFLEDLDLSLRAQLLGHRGLYVPSAVVFHQGHATFASRGRKEIFRLITRNQLWMVIKNYPGTVLLRALPRIAVFQLLWLGLMFSRGLGTTYLRAVWQALCGLPRMLRKRRTIQRQRNISAGQFWNLLKESEEEIALWQGRLEFADRSWLLRIYFAIFGWPTTRSRVEAAS